MMPQKIILLIVGIALTFLPGLAGAAKKEAKEPAPKIEKLIVPSQTNWVQAELQDNKSVFLTNSYLFQVMKGAAQENQKRIEESLIIPALQRILRSLVASSSDPEVSRLFGVPLAILVDDPKMELAPEVLSQAKDILHDLMFAPRGHYNDSEALGKYFRAMQYLSKVTMDVSIRLDSFPFPEFMLFKFETAVKAVELMSNESNSKILEQWMAIHDFYAKVNGRADTPTFADLLQMAKDKPLTKDGVKEWAVSEGLPKINRERGIGIQPFGERSSLHQEVIDEVKSKFMKDDTPREAIAKLLAFRNLAEGLDLDGQKIEGLAERMKTNKPENYYSATMAAINQGAHRWKQNKFALNFFAAALTGLAEQTALMAKTSILVRKSAEHERPVAPAAKLYLGKDSDKYIRALGLASDSLLKTCKALQSKLPSEPQSTLQLLDQGPLFQKLATVARESRPEINAQAIWQRFGEPLGKLTRKSAVTVDVFQVRERSGKMFYFQWAIAPFEVVVPIPGLKTPPKGLETVFFEGWADEIVHDHDGPLDNLLWEGRVQEGGLQKIQSIIPIPEDASRD